MEYYHECYGLWVGWGGRLYFSVPGAMNSWKVQGASDTARSKKWMCTQLIHTLGLVWFLILSHCCHSEREAPF